MYYEIYYWMCYYVRKIKSNEYPDFASVLLVSMMQFLNLAVLLVIIENGIGIRILKDRMEINSVNLIYVYIFGLIVIFINILLLYRNRHEIHKKVAERAKRYMTLRKFLFWAYIVLSFVLLKIVGDIYLDPVY